MPDAYSYGGDQPERARRRPLRPARVLIPLLVVAGLGYLLVFAPGAPLAAWGAKIRGTLADVSDGYLTGDAAGTPDDIQARWNEEFGAGEAAFDTAGPTAAMLFRNNMRGLRNALERDEREKVKRWRAGIEKNFREGRAWRAERADPSDSGSGP